MIVMYPRNYLRYANEMEQNIHEKFCQTIPFVQPGKIGDVGCATGSWIALALRQPELSSSEFYGVEVEGQAYKICIELQKAGKFGTRNVSFLQRDAALNQVFEFESMNTIHTSSVTHEVRSQVCQEELRSYLLCNPEVSIVDASAHLGYLRLRKFIYYRYRELKPGGVWIIRDLIGSVEGKKEVYLELLQKDGLNEFPNVQFAPHEHKELAEYLSKLSTYSRFLRFACDFQKSIGYCVKYKPETLQNKCLLRVRLRDACEFAMKKDYLHDWQAEMSETFCFWDMNQWIQALISSGFEVLPESKTFTSRWILNNRLKGKLRLFLKHGSSIEPLNYPSTHAIIVARKPHSKLTSRK